MVKSLKFLRHRRTDAGYFSEFLIAKTPGDLENREPRAPQQLQQQMTLPTVLFAAPQPVIATLPMVVQPDLSMSVGLPYSATVAMREEEVVTTSAPARPPSPPARPQPTRSQDPLRLARRRERNRAAAAKCRQRRQNQLDLLADCVRELESENGDLEAEVAELAAARAQLEAAIRQHAVQCDGTKAARHTDVLVEDDEAAASVWLTQALSPITPVSAAARPTSLSLSAAGSSSKADELPSLMTPRGCVGANSSLTPLLATPQSAFKLESMLLM